MLDGKPANKQTKKHELCSGPTKTLKKQKVSQTAWDLCECAFLLSIFGSYGC